MPEIQINLKKIQHNAKTLKSFLLKKKISIIGVTKVVLGNPIIARVLTDAGIEYLGDSRIQNLITMKKHKINAKFVLIRVPSKSEIPTVIQFADYSLNSEIDIIKLLSEEALKKDKIHNIILMVDMGDLREGVNPSNLEEYIDRIDKFEGVRIVGIGTNLKCFGGIIPTKLNMEKLSNIAKDIEIKFNLKLEFVSGGNSANFNWLMSCEDPGKINNLRIGEALFLGHETVNFRKIPNLYTDAITLKAEIVELKQRSLKTQGIAVSNAFGESIQKKTLFKSEDGKKFRMQALLNIGRQDIAINGLNPLEKINILGASSDYLIVDLLDNDYQVGEELNFRLNYEALLRAMTSPYISKRFII
jgi:predicted amino acid racemase